MIADVLLVIDMQNGVCQTELGEIENFNQCLNKINKRIQHYRNKEKPIIFIQHNDDTLEIGSFNWEIVPELDTCEQDLYISKTHANSFYYTDLQHILTKLSVESIEICGAQTEYCVDTTVKTAHSFGYYLFMYTGLSTTFDNLHMNAKETISFYESIWDKRFLNLIKS